MVATWCIRCSRTYEREQGDHGRCPECRKPAEQERDRARVRDRPWYQNGWREKSKAAIKQHVARVGYRCPLCPNAHKTKNPLTTDHVTARDASRLRVICRSCNSRKGATTDRKRTG